MKDYANSLFVGTVVKTRGVKGELVIELNEKNLFKNIKESLFVQINGLMVPFFIEQIQQINNTRASVKLHKIDNKKKSTELYNNKVFIPNEDFTYTNNEISPSLLIGFEVTDENYGNIGTIENFIENKNNPLLVIKYNKKEILLPFNQHFICNINSQNKQININAPKGLIDIYL